MSDLDTQMVELTKTVQELEEKKTELEEQLKDYTEETSQQVLHRDYLCLIKPYSVWVPLGRL